jgi:hypothetical protein
MTPIAPSVGQVDHGPDREPELPVRLSNALDQAGWSHELRAQALRLHGVAHLAELFGAVSTTVELTPAPDPIERARAQRAWALHHTGA